MKIPTKCCCEFYTEVIINALSDIFYGTIKYLYTKTHTSNIKQPFLLAFFFS